MTFSGSAGLSDWAVKNAEPYETLRHWPNLQGQIGFFGQTSIFKTFFLGSMYNVTC